MLRFKSTLLILALSTLGAGISVIVLLMTATDGFPTGTGRMDLLPIVVFVAGMGFGAGALIAIAWLITQRLFWPDISRA